MKKNTSSIIALLVLLTLLSSIAASAFVIGNIDMVFAKKSGGGDGGSGDKAKEEGGGDGSSDSSDARGEEGGDGSGGGSNTSPSASDTTTPPSSDNSQQSTTSGSDTGEQQQQQQQQQTCPDGSTPDANGNCPSAAETPLSPPSDQQAQQQQQQQTCPDGSQPDASGTCPGTTQATSPVDGTGTAQPAQGLIGPALGGAPDDILTKKLFCGQGNRFDVKTNQCIPVNAPVCDEEGHVSNGYCVSDYFSLDNGGCVIGRHPGKPDLGRTFCDQDEPTKTTQTPAPTPIPTTLPSSTALPNPDGSCPSGYHKVQNQEKQLCVIDTSTELPTKTKTTTPTTPPTTPATPATTDTMKPVKCGKGTHTDPTDPKLGQCTVNDEPLPNGACAAGWHFGKDQSICFKDTTTTPAKNCAAGSHYDTNYRDCIDDRYPILSKTGIGSTCIAGYHLEADKLCHKDTTTTSQPNQLPTQTGGTTTTGNPTTTTTPASPPPTSTSTSTSTTTTTSIVNNKNVVRGGSGGSTAATSSAPPTTAQTTNNNFLTYVNAVNKITIQYPSTWTKTESIGGDSSIPVIFNAPPIVTTTGSSTAPTAAAKTTFMISIGNLLPQAANPVDGYTQKQVYALTHSNIKYSITDANAKVLTPPGGITVYREISYDGAKTTVLNNNNVGSQIIPLKGTGIFFVIGDKGYSLLYLAKQTEYAQNLRTIQQMISSFKIGSSVGSHS